MKPFYILVTCLIISFPATLFAQRNIDLKLNNFWSATSSTTFVEFKSTDTLHFNGVQKYYFGYGIKNLSADSVSLSDTIKIQTDLGFVFNAVLSTFAPPANVPLKMNDSIMIMPTMNPYTLAKPTGNNPQYQAVTWCDSMWLVDSTSNIVSDPDLSNNYKCTNITAQYFVVGVDGVVKTDTEAFLLYPNPATNTLNIKYNFGSNTTAHVSVMDVLGKVVYTQDLGVKTGVQDIALNLTRIPQGNYIVKLTTDAGNFTERLTVN